jgi:hypothetical protein
VFDEELTQLKLPHDVYPAFYLLDARLRPLDSIHGGEWDDDIAENIAPVLGAFVQGNYRNRRYHSSPTSLSIRL